MSPQKAIPKFWPRRKTGFGLGRKAVQGSQGLGLQVYPPGYDLFPGGCYPWVASVLVLGDPGKTPVLPSPKYLISSSLNPAAFTEDFEPYGDANATERDSSAKGLRTEFTSVFCNLMSVEP